MDDIVSIRKKIIRKETLEEFYLNSCERFITGKIKELDSNDEMYLKMLNEPAISIAKKEFEKYLPENISKQINNLI